MVLTDRQRHDLHAGIYEYLLSRPGDAFQRAAAALAEADPDACHKNNNNNASTNNNSNNNNTTTAATNTTPSKSSSSSLIITPLLEKKWTAIPRLQKKVLELERAAAQHAKIHAHRTGASSHTADAAGGTRRMLPRLPATFVLQGHAAVVLAVEVHPVFTMVVSGSEDGTIKVWDHESGEYIRTLKGHTSTVNALAFCPTGTHLASCSTDLSIKLWDFTNTYTCVRTLRGHDHTISSVKFAPISAIVGMANAAAAANHHHHRGTNGTSSSSFHYNTTTTTAASSSSSTGMDVATTGSSYLLSASRDQTVKLWHVETGFCDHTVTDHTDWVRCLAVRKSESSSFTWASSGNDQVIYVYEHRDKVMELRGHEHVVESLAFLTEAPTTNNTSSSSSLSSSSTKLHQHQNQQQGIVKDARDYLASGGRDRTVRLWKVSTGECLAVFKNHENWVRSVLIHPSGNYVISAGDDRSIRVFDIKANRCLRTLDGAHPHFVTSLAMHYTLPILISGGVDQTVRCWLLD